MGKIRFSHGTFDTWLRVSSKAFRNNGHLSWENLVVFAHFFFIWLTILNFHQVHLCFDGKESQKNVWNASVTEKQWSPKGSHPIIGFVTLLRTGFAHLDFGLIYSRWRPECGKAQEGGNALKEFNSLKLLLIVSPVYIEICNKSWVEIPNNVFNVKWNVGKCSKM